MYYHNHAAVNVRLFETLRPNICAAEVNIEIILPTQQAVTLADLQEVFRDSLTHSWPLAVTTFTQSTIKPEYLDNHNQRHAYSALTNIFSGRIDLLVQEADFPNAKGLLFIIVAGPSEMTEREAIQFWYRVCQEPNAFIDLAKKLALCHNDQCPARDIVAFQKSLYL